MALMGHTRDATGWRRLIGSPKLQIIFHKRATKYRSLLRKMTYKDKGSYESSPPCMSKSTNLYVWLDSLGIHGRRTCRFQSLRFQCISAQSSISCESETNKLPQNIGGCQFLTLELFREWYRWCFLKQNLFFLEKWLMHTTQWAYRRCCSWLDSFVCVQWRIHTRDMTHLYVWHGSFICVIWQCMLFGTLHIYVCDMAHVTWRVYSCDVTRLAYIQYVSFCVCDMTHS